VARTTNTLVMDVLEPLSPIPVGAARDEVGVLSRLAAAATELGAASASESLPALLERVARLLTEITESASATLFRVDSETLVEVTTYTRPQREPIRPDRHLLHESPAARHVLATHRPRVVPLADAGHVTSALLLPLTCLGRTWGAACVYGADDSRAEADPVDVASTLLTCAGALIHGLEGREQAQNTYYEVVASLARALDVEQIAEQEHLDRVVSLSRSVAIELGVDGKALHDVELGALLHDIGMSRLPDAVLGKRGLLDPEERRLVEKHPVIGEAILAPISGIGAARAIVRSHHEWWNGDGYPDRLRGEAIPLGARIVTVCDVFSALTEERSYRTALTSSEALEELELYSGVHFDPGCIAALRLVLQQRGVVDPDLAAPAPEPEPAAA
jgi:HD-GYP domain-containing protein (c-di-GMP phosphodiesterase class II)